MFEPAKYEVLTFDCYGTLIDWETGILAALSPVLSARDINLSDPEILRLYAELEAKVEEGPYVKYREVLRRVVRQIGDRLGIALSEPELDCLGNSLGTWPAFPDTIEALRKLKERYRLAVVSNVDDDLFARSAKLLEVDFDWVITSEQARSYKPSLRNFRLAVDTMSVPVGKVLHVAESIHHDIEPATALGLSTVWVNRGRSERRDATASGADSYTTDDADIEVPDLKTLASLMVSNSI